MASRNIQDDIDTLLEIASRKIVKVKSKPTYPQIDLFIEQLKIKSGKQRIPAYIVYYYYHTWHLNNKYPLVSNRRFINYFQTKFEKTRTDHGIGFLLNSKPFDLSPAGFFRARSFIRKQREEKANSKARS